MLPSDFSLVPDDDPIAASLVARKVPADLIDPGVWGDQLERTVECGVRVRNVRSEMVFTPPWSPERMSEDAKFALGF